jgi:PDDEXK-like domain of unknown function (DUF3799)
MSDAYHSHPAWSATKIKDAATGTPLDWWAKHVDPNRTPFQPTEPMRQGSLVDCMITEPQHFAARYVVLPEDAPKRPTATQLKAKKPSEETCRSIAWWAEFEAAHEGHEIIPLQWFNTADAIIKRLHADPDIGPILRMPRSSQEPHFWTDEQGRECRYKPDLEPEDGSLWDLKKARSAHPRRFAAQAYDLGYDIQIGAHYRLGFIDRHGKAPIHSGFIAYEWQYPHNCSLCYCTEEFIELGLDRRARALERIEDCIASDYWPSYGVSNVTAPAYADFTSADDETDADSMGLEGL